jgi:predicted MFS family arabinose efflux permease
MRSPISIPLTDRPPLLTWNFLLLCAAHLLFGLSFWSYVLLPVFLQGLGAGLVEVGVLMGTASLAGILVRPWIGSRLDRIGRRICLIGGGFIFLTANLSYLWVDRIGWGIYAVRLLHGAGMGILMATFFTLAADLSPASRRTEGIALFGVSGHLAGALGVLLGEQILRWEGYHALFKVGAGLAALSVLVSFSIREPASEREAFPEEAFLKMAMNRAIRIPLAATFAFGVGMTSYMVFLKPYAFSVGMGSISYFFLAYSLTAVAVRLIGADWPDRFGLKSVLYPAQLSLAIGVVFIFLRPSPAGLVFSGLLCGIGHGFIFPILSVLVISRQHEARRGSLMTLFTLLYDLGLLVGAPLLGLMANRQGYPTMFIVAALAVFSSWLLFLLLDREEAG